jgi:hypothetical protein
MKDITKEWPAEFLVPIEYVDLSDPDIIEIPMVTCVEYDGHTSVKKKKKKEEVQENDEEDRASEESRLDSPARGGGDELNQEEGGEEGEKQGKGRATQPKDPLTTIETLHKRKVSLEKPSARKKACENNPQLKNVLTMNDVDLSITVVEDASKDILQRHGKK